MRELQWTGPRQVGGFDGESFSNTATLADLGWTAHYVEPIPDFAAQCENRHRHNPNTKVGMHSHLCQHDRHHMTLIERQVHRLAVTGHEASGKRITLRPAGPFTSGLDEETSLADTSFGDCLRCVGWGVAKELVHADATDLDTFCDKHLRLTPARVTADPTARAAPTGTTTRAAAAAAAADKASPRGDLPSDWASQAPEDLLRALRDCEFAMDLLIVDVEGLEWTILQDFDIARWRPRVAIVEIQEKLRRYRDSGRAAADAIHIETWFAQHGYSILYRDAINTVFVHRGHICHGESS